MLQTHHHTTGNTVYVSLAELSAIPITKLGRSGLTDGNSGGDEVVGGARGGVRGVGGEGNIVGGQRLQVS